MKTPLCHIDATGDCWLWTARSRTGRKNEYGQVRINGKTKPAHRAVWETLVGPIEDGLVMDHLCKNTLCVNPDHLQPVTQAENAKRSAVGHYHPRSKKHRAN